MKLDISKIFIHLFYLLCVLGTIGFCIDCILKYLSNEDAPQTEYQKFHQNDKDNIYPSVSFCIINPFLETKLNGYGENIDTTSYSYFLQGLHWDDRMQDIDYDNVTVSLDNALIRIKIEHHDYTSRLYDHLNERKAPPAWVPTPYVSFRSAIRKCFTFDIPYMENKLIWYIAIDIANTLFPKGVRPLLDIQNMFNGTDPSQGDGFLVYFHYPGQRFTSLYTVKYEWAQGTNITIPYYMEFYVEDIGVMKHRSKPEQKCVKDWKNYDQRVMERIMTKDAGCRPPHWHTSLNLSLCTTMKQMKFFIDQPSKLPLRPPCNTIQRLRYTYYERQWNKEFNG